MKRKAVADVTEVLIGAFFMSSNFRTTIQFMHWLGLKVIPVHENSGELITLPNIVLEGLNEEIRVIEIQLKYIFRKKEYLIASFFKFSDIQIEILR